MPGQARLAPGKGDEIHGYINDIHDIHDIQPRSQQPAPDQPGSLQLAQNQPGSQQLGLGKDGEWAVGFAEWFWRLSKIDDFGAT